MKRPILMALFLVAFALAPSLVAQTRKQPRNKSATRNPQNEATLNAMPDPKAEASTPGSGFFGPAIATTR